MTQPPNLSAPFSDRLRFLSEIAGGVSALALAAALPSSSLHNYIARAGNQKPSEPNRRALLAIAAATGVSLRWLLAGQGRRPDAAAVAAHLARCTAARRGAAR